MYSGYPNNTQPTANYHGPPPSFNNQHQQQPWSGAGPSQQPQYGQQPSYQQPPPPPGPPPPPAIANDPDAFAAMYRSHLASLTFNSKPIITNLTVMAHENVQTMSNVVARSLDEHICQAPPPYRIPALYTLDSISKNIGAPYTSLWSQRIAHLFLDSYRIVDQPTKVRMEELLTTWRTGGPDGRPLFGGEAQWAIEKSLYGSQGLPGRSPLPPPPTAPPSIRSPVPGHGLTADKARAVEQIDRLLAQGTQDQYRNPASFNPTRMSALRQLKTVIQTAPLTPVEMGQIQTQLDSLAQEFAASRPMSATPSQQPAVPAPLPSSNHGGASHLHPMAAIPSNISDALASLTRQGALGGSGSPAPTPPTQAPQGGADDLMKSLMAAGLLPGPGSSAASAKTARQDDAYADAILSLDLKLTSIDLQKEVPPEAVELVCHKYLPLQCRQCANRYPAGASGQRSLDKHLDWHFRQGRRHKESTSRGMHRSWFDKAMEWIRGGHDDPSTSGKAGGGSGGDGDATTAARGLSAQQEAELKAASEQWLPAPTDASLTNVPCPICKEKFQSEWSEEEEEWIWKNARKVEGSVAYYHGSCYYSAKVLSATVSSRTTTPPGRRSTESRRSRTASPGVRRGAASANPVERLKGEEEGVNGSGGSRKRKENPAVGTIGEEAEEDGDVHDDKRPAM